MRRTAVLCVALITAACTTSGERPATAARPAVNVVAVQVPAWSPSDLELFLHGSMSAPYLHNGSVRTLAELLTPPAERPAAWQRGSRRYDTAALGYADEGPYRFDARAPGNGNGGHAFGTDLAAAEKRDLLEFLKTR